MKNESRTQLLSKGQLDPQANGPRAEGAKQGGEADAEVALAHEVDTLDEAPWNIRPRSAEEAGAGGAGGTKTGKGGKPG